MSNHLRKDNLKGQDRLIVALDVPTHDEAIKIVDELSEVSFFKVGLELFMAGGMLGFLEKLQKRGERDIFVDLKLSGDIGNTITKMVQASMHLNVKFITLVQSHPQSITAKTLQAACAARGRSDFPRFLMVPLLSSLDANDLPSDKTVDEFIVEQGRKLRNQGCDGLIVSGRAISACRKEFPQMDIVSPGIRPQGTKTDDHKRFTTPEEAIQMGSDYLVVGRPITKAANRKRKLAAQKIIEEIDRALKKQQSHKPNRHSSPPLEDLSAHP